MPSRVLFLHSSAGLYGADRQLVALAGGLQSRGFAVTTVIPERGSLAARLEAAGVDVVVHPLAVLRRRLLSPGGIARLGIQGVRERSVLAGLCRGCSLVHSNTSVILWRPRDVPHVVHVREIYAGLAPRAWPLWRRRLMQADARICVSHAVAAQFDPAGTHVIHDGSPRALSSLFPAMRERLKTAPFRVAVLGRISDWKGQDVLIRALAEPALAEIGAQAVIAGDAYPGEAAPDIRALANALGVADRVEFAGFVANPEEFLASVDAVAVPSTRPDPLPNSAIEAQAAGLPVVAANHGGLPEIVNDGTTGILVAPDDAVGLAQALRALADDPAKREQMGEAAAEDARNRFTVDRMLDDVEAVYATLGVKR
ncbi:MAG TPA: glycosyltransferase family 4 protein [Thermoleophilaceae bacterium]